MKKIAKRTYTFNLPSFSRRVFVFFVCTASRLPPGTSRFVYFGESSRHRLPLFSAEGPFQHGCRRPGAGGSSKQSTPLNKRNIARNRTPAGDGGLNIFFFHLVCECVFICKRCFLPKTPYTENTNRVATMEEYEYKNGKKITRNTRGCHATSIAGIQIKVENDYD